MYIALFSPNIKSRPDPARLWQKESSTTRRHHSLVHLQLLDGRAYHGLLAETNRSLRPATKISTFPPASKWVFFTISWNLFIYTYYKFVDGDFKLVVWAIREAACRTGWITTSRAWKPYWTKWKGRPPDLNLLTWITKNPSSWLTFLTLIGELEFDFDRPKLWVVYLICLCSQAKTGWPTAHWAWRFSGPALSIHGSGTSSSLVWILQKDFGFRCQRLRRPQIRT